MAESRDPRPRHPSNRLTPLRGAITGEEDKHTKDTFGCLFWYTDRMTIPHLMDPDEFFPDPHPSTIVEDVQKEIAKHALENEMKQRERDAYAAEIMHMVVGAETSTDQ